ncbi:chitin synthase chs-1 isoform X1 [Patella vulgata]|uniref:chitin synthase chs-1 isoform X1 n=2 Tax=Patella vulgata TaxID=6465 RepID=UPI00217F5854|nr:chitin synthase chs-1 isoform X1 [Patella vulgata]
MRTGEVLLAIVLSALGTLFFLASKLSFLILLAQKPQVPQDQWYAAIGIVLVVPEVITLLRIVWSTSFLVRGHILQWPSVKAILLGLFSSLLEMAAVTFFTLEVAPKLPSYIVLPLVNVVLFLQIMLSQWKRNKQKSFLASHDLVPDTSWIKRTLHSIATTFGVCIFVLTACLLVILEITEIPEAVSLVASMTALSVVWCKPIKSFAFNKECPSETARNNTSLVQTIIRIAGIVGFTILIIPMGSNITLEESPGYVLRGLRSLKETESLYTGIIMHCITAFIAYALTRVSAFYTTSRSGIMIPVLLSTVLSTVMFVYNCLDNVINTFHEEACSIHDGGFIVLGFVALIWILPVLILRKKYFMPSDVLFKPEQENFITYNYCSVYFDQHVFLNYNPKTSIEHRMSSQFKRSRVFLCTTMYREADYEMEQLLKSLAKVSKSTKLKLARVYLESHIFLDNGTDGCTLKEFALQLMSLVESTLDVGRSEGRIFHTPYGIQISSILPGGMPLFLHLKDPNFVKAKKRWSQVMYFEYILNHRIKVTDALERRSSFDIFQISDKDKLHLITSDSRETELILRLQRNTTVLKVPDDDLEQQSINSKSGSQMSSDQGIDDTCDDISTISSENKDAQRVNDAAPNKDAKQTIQFPQPGSTENISQSEFNISKLNPAYEPEVNEIMPTPWMSEFMNGSRASSVVPTIREIAPDGSEYLHDGGMFSADGSLYLDMSIEEPEFDDRTYILATDADMHFSDASVLDLVETCNEDMRLGAACGRTYPMGKKINPIVWFQKFEYAKDFWMIKSAQNIIGSVMCCPGCFSLYRVKALAGVMNLYSEPTMEAGDVFTKDTGEDRWMCTLMMLRGWKLRYSTFGVNSTYCPDTIEEFIKQRRRWILSDFANSLMVFRNMPQLIRSNGCFSLIYVLYLLQLFFIVFLSPGSTVVMLTVGLEMLINAPFIILTPIIVVLFIAYGILCVRLSSPSQIQLTKFCMVILGLSMSCVVVGAAIYVIRDLVIDVMEDNLQPQEHFILVALTGSLFYAAMLHPRECYTLVHGLFYIFFFPAMHMLLPIYALCNIVDQTWGTRDNQKAKIPKLLCFPKFRRKKKKKKGMKTSPSTETLDLETEMTPEQLKGMSEEEQTFWNDLVLKFIGKDVNLGLEKDDLASGLNSLRIKALVAVLISNVIWVAVIGYFYLSAVDDNSLNGYAVMSGALYGFSFCIQVVGMTVYRAKDCIHKLGKAIFKMDKPVWITKPDDSHN